MHFELKVWFGFGNAKSISKSFSSPEKSVRLCLIRLFKTPRGQENYAFTLEPEHVRPTG